ncbi:MAG: M13 family metallopeptidase [Vulcanimicrobiota bacterium]
MKRLFLALAILCCLPAWAAPPTGLDPADMDTTVSPAENFYLYANGGWMKRNPIPSDRPRWGTFNVLAENNQAVCREILEELGRQNPAPGSEEQKLADFYASGMDTKAINAAGLKPLADELARIEAITDQASLQAEVARLHSMGVWVYFNFGAVQDSKDSSKVIGQLSQGGLGLPDRDYYFRDDEASRKIRSGYQGHLVTMFNLMGPSAQGSAHDSSYVYDFESKLAKDSMTRVALRDPEATYNPKTLAELKAVSPHFDWATYFQRMGVEIEWLNVATPDFFKALDAALTQTPIETHKTYLRWHLVHSQAPSLAEPFETATFNFYGKALTGAEKMQPRWKRVVAATDGAIGMALGKKFVARKFPPEAKVRVEELIANLRAALREDLETLEWMSPATRLKAVEKLQAIRQKIGYPDQWRDYSSLTIKPGAYAENALAAQAFEVARDLAKIGKPVDPNEWYMTPQTVNAYYDPSSNEIVFPAGILQPPFFSNDYDDALNYGALGMVIGHELTHGFDDQGSKYDAKGNLENWWTDDDKLRFEGLAERIVKQFDEYTVADNLHINGKLVVGESIADLGGLKLAYRALQKAWQKNPPDRSGKFNPEQRFFLAYARVWAMNMRPEYERLQVNTDPHPHPRYRVNGPLSNLPEFEQAFKIPPGSPMLREGERRNAIW